MFEFLLLLIFFFRIENQYSILEFDFEKEHHIIERLYIKYVPEVTIKPPKTINSGILVAV